MVGVLPYCPRYQTSLTVSPSPNLACELTPTRFASSLPFAFPWDPSWLLNPTRTSFNQRLKLGMNTKKKQKLCELVIATNLELWWVYKLGQEEGCRWAWEAWYELGELGWCWVCGHSYWGHFQCVWLDTMWWRWEEQRSDQGWFSLHVWHSQEHKTCPLSHLGAESPLLQHLWLGNFPSLSFFLPHKIRGWWMGTFNTRYYSL